jgi:methylated-DNA-[protein]-cysteine S-methyltransferase
MTKPHTYDTATIDSSVGALELRATGDALVSLLFADGPSAAPATSDVGQEDLDKSPILRRAADQLREYFAGERIEFDLPLRPDGTSFQRRVWATLAEIPYGETWSYGELARRIGSPTAFRAVGAANGQNPLPIVLPCHRVIGADGSLTGFGGGLHLKRFLLEHEGALLPLG